MTEFRKFLGLPIDLHILVIRERCDPCCPAFFLKLVQFFSGANSVTGLGLRCVIKRPLELPNWYWIPQRMSYVEFLLYICPNNERHLIPAIHLGYSIWDNMDPWTHNYVKLKTGHTYHYVDQKPDPARANGDTMICLHGFPDQWFGWRNQIEPWARAGYRVIVPSMLGYGGSVRRNP